MREISERPRPYVGVSGIVSPHIQAEVQAAAREVELEKKGRLLALGVKAVHKTQFLDVPNKYGPQWYPVGADSFRGAMSAEAQDQDLLAVAQVYLDVYHVGDPEYRKHFTAQIVERGQPWLQALQFDMLPWHSSPDMLTFLQETKEEFGLGILLQCHKDAMQELGPKGVVRRLGHVASFVNYLLFDASHGTGTRLDANSLDPFLEEAHSSTSLDTTGIAIAGGLDAASVREDLPELVSRYPDLSWDAEGRLHPVNERGERPLNVQIARDYLHASTAVLKTA